MRKIWFTADTHFNHWVSATQGILAYCPKRPWTNIEEMNEALIDNWNRVVAPGDTVIHLGDFAMGDRKETPRFIERLAGEITLIRGNHDRTECLKFFNRTYQHLDIEVEGVALHLTHSPHRIKRWDRHVLCGHVHESWSSKKLYYDNAWVEPYHVINVGVDARRFRPVSLAELLADLPTQRDGSSAQKDGSSTQNATAPTQKGSSPKQDSGFLESLNRDLYSMRGPYALEESADARRC
jgi:calcineurin-like phosphoesterase family protein